MKRALITGITGQDGSYLAELLCPRATRSMGSSAGRRRSTRAESTHLYRIPTSTTPACSCTTAT